MFVRWSTNTYPSKPVHHNPFVRSLDFYFHKYLREQELFCTIFDILIEQNNRTSIVINFHCNQCIGSDGVRKFVGKGVKYSAEVQLVKMEKMSLIRVVKYTFAHPITLILQVCSLSEIS